MKEPVEFKRQSHFVLIVVIFALIGGFIGYSFVMGNHNPTPTNKEFMLVHNNHSPVDTLEIVYKDQFVEDTLETSVLNAETDPSAISKVEAKETIYNQNTAFLGWTMLIVIMMSIAAASFPVFAYEIWVIFRDFHLKWFNVLISFALAGIFFFIAYEFARRGGGFYKPNLFINEMGVLLKDGDMLDTTVGITIGFQLSIFMTVFLIPVAADRITADKSSAAEMNEAARRFKQLESILRKCLHVMAVLVVFSVLTSSALGASLNTTISIDGFNVFPPEFGYVYGLLFSFLLAMIYVPVHYYIRFKSRSFIQQLYEEDCSEDELKNIGEVKEKVLIKQSALDNLKVAFTVVAPLVSSFLPDFINLL